MLHVNKFQLFQQWYGAGNEALGHCINLCSASKCLIVFIPDNLIKEKNKNERKEIKFKLKSDVEIWATADTVESLDDEHKGQGETTQCHCVIILLQNTVKPS